MIIMTIDNKVKVGNKLLINLARMSSLMSRISFLVSLLFGALVDNSIPTYVPFKFLINYIIIHAYNYTCVRIYTVECKIKLT